LSELVFVKLGGSLLTDKTRSEALRPEVLIRLAAEIVEACAARPDLRLVIGHGSGSYGHMVARQYGTRWGVASPAAWRGYAETATVAARLNRLVVDALWAAGLPVLPVQPSASARCRGGELMALDDYPIHVGLGQGLVPVVYGDVALDEAQGGTIISTEEIFRWLAPRLLPRRILLVGEVDGVLTADPAESQDGDLIAEITPQLWPEIAPVLGGSRGVDVTGGMLAKVREMLALAQATPGLAAVQIISGLCPGVLAQALADPAACLGTRIHAT
jgi:isopentenyl phosphate kinase